MLRFDKRLPDLGWVCPVVTWYGENFSQPYEKGGNDSQDGERNSKYEEGKYDERGDLLCYKESVEEIDYIPRRISRQLS